MHDDRDQDAFRDDLRDDDGRGPRARRPNIILILLAVFGGGVLLVCCGGLGFVWYQARNAGSTDPAKIREVTAEITDLDMPAEFEPKVSMSVFGALKLVVYARPNPEQGQIVLSAIATEGVAHPQQQEMMQQQWDGRGHGKTRNLKMLNSTTREIEIRGTPVKFEIAEMEDPDSKQKLRRVLGTFPAKKGVAMLMMMVPEENYDEEAVVKFLESIH